MRMNVPTGVCRSASTDRTTGTPLPCRASRSNASNDAGCRSSMLTAYHPVGREPLTAIDHQHNTIDITRRLRTNKDRCLFNIRDSSKTAQGNVLPQAIFDVFRHETLHSFRVFNWTRRDPVHTNSIPAPLDGEISRQRIDPRLRRRHVKLKRRANVVKRRGDVQDLSAMFLELRNSRATNVECSF